jgi:hypothetical protein
MCIKINKVCKQEVGILWVQKRFPRYGIPMWSLWPNIRFLQSIVSHLLPILDLIIPPFPEGGEGYTVSPLSVSPSKIFFVTFFSETIDGRNLIFGHKLHIGSKCVDLILIRLAKCWNNLFSSKCCIWLYCENVKSEYFFFSPVQPNCFLQDSESKYTVTWQQSLLDIFIIEIYNS